MSGNMLNRDGWREITCDESNVLRRQIIDSPGHDGVVLSSLTDPDGSRSGMKVVYTEWGRDVPELRDYRWTDGKCEHLVPARPARPSGGTA